MPAIIPALKIDADLSLSKHFLPYQVAWILDDSMMRLAEKSVRVGWTFGDAFKNVRKRLRHPKRDYLFATKDQASAIEYMQICHEFCEIYNFTKSIVAHGEDVMKVHGTNDKGEKVTEEVKFGFIKFDNKSRIIAFSSNPYAMQVYGGDVGLDEFPKHPQQEKLWETASPRTTWGYDIGVWGSHDGTDTLMYQFAQEAAKGVGAWSHYRVTIVDAIEMGLVEKINSTRGTNYTRESFLEDCKKKARLPEIFEQAYMCNPVGSMSAIVPWATIQMCRQSIVIERAHWESHMVKEMFGTYDRMTAQAREALIARVTASLFPRLYSTPGRYRIGFDVAASGEGDLASMYVLRDDGSTTPLAGLLTMRTDDWHVMKHALWAFMKGLTDIRGCGDETGLGKQICWETAVQFPGAFEGVNFRGTKHDMGFEIMNAMTEGALIWPDAAEHADIAQDFFSLRKHWAAGSWKFSETKNLLNSASHCDIAWSGALARKACTVGGTGVWTPDALAGVTLGGPVAGLPQFTPRKLR